MALTLDFLPRNNQYAPPLPTNSDELVFHWNQTQSEFVGRGGRGVRGRTIQESPAVLQLDELKSLAIAELKQQNLLTPQPPLLVNSAIA